jgi:hypothetical protein
MIIITELNTSEHVKEEAGLLEWSFYLLYYPNIDMGQHCIVDPCGNN